MLLSDRLVSDLATNPEWLALAQSYKGIGFIVVTSALLLVLVRWGHLRLLSALDKVRAGEHQIQGLFLQHPEPMWVYDKDSLRFLAVNDAAVEHYGYSEREFLSMTVKDITAPEDVQRWKQNTSTEHIVRHNKKNAGSILVDVSSHPVTFHGRQARLAMAQDVTEEALSQEVVERQERQFKQLHDSLQEALWLYSADSQKVLYVSTAFQRVYGRPGGDLINDPALWSKVIHDEDRGLALQALSDLQASGRSECEYRIERPDGELRWVCDRRRNIVGSDGVVLMVGGIVEDITDSKKTTLALRQLNDELEARVSSRTEELRFVNQELDAFTRTAAHDLRSPLHAISGFVQILRFRYKDSLGAAGDAMAGHIETAATSMAKLVGDLLVLSRVTTQTVHRVPTDVEGIALAIVRNLKSEAPGRQVAIQVEPMEAAQADEGLVRSLMTNLLDNAWKYTGKRIDASIEVGCTAAEGKQVFFVRDNGAGFDMGKAVELFKPFQRFHSATEFAGSGVGLATCQRIVRRHGGSIWIASACGEGTTVYFTLTPATDTSLPASLSRDSNFAQLA
ncbi:MAG TPA: ATP-binding protein [Burkholderiaceae bacterium]|nr:ATP-binding protein [Burkholderiaceae bacterium]